MKRFSSRTESRPVRQRCFEFIDRSRRRERWFKLAIIAATCLAIGVVLGVAPAGRYVAASASDRGEPDFAKRDWAFPRRGTEIDEKWQRFRLQGIADSRRALPEIYDNATPAVQRLMRYAGLDPEHGLLRWGNYDRTCCFPRRYSQADERGVPIGLRPCVDAIWLREITIRSGVLMFFLVPDGPGLGRRDTRDAGDPGRNVAAVDQFLGPARPRA